MPTDDVRGKSVCGGCVDEIGGEGGEVAVDDCAVGGEEVDGGDGREVVEFVGVDLSEWRVAYGPSRGKGVGVTLPCRRVGLEGGDEGDGEGAVGYLPSDGGVTGERGGQCVAVGAVGVEENKECHGAPADGGGECACASAAVDECEVGCPCAGAVLCQCL